MKVQQPVNNQNNILYRGTLKIKGPTFATTIREHINSSEKFKDLSKKNDVTVRLKYKVNNSTDIEKSVLFKIKYTLLKENSFIDKTLDFLHLKPQKDFNKQYLPAKKLLKLLDNK